MEILVPRYKSIDDEIEFQKLFSVISTSFSQFDDELNQVFDLNQNCIITINNLIPFLQKYTKNISINKNNVGSIIKLLNPESRNFTYEVFCQNMEDILDHINCFEGLYKKRNRIAYGYNERRVLHKWIANYFWLNTKGIDFQIDPSNQLQIENNINFEFKLLEIGYDLDFDKTSLINDSLAEFGKFQEGMNEVDLFLQMNLFHLNKFFRIITYSLNIFEVYQHLEIISEGLSYIFSNNIFERLLQSIISNDSALEVKFEALKALSIILFCSKLKNADTDCNILKFDTVKQNLFHPDFLTLLVDAACCDWIEIRYYCLLCLSFMIEYDEGTRIFILKSQLIQNLYAGLSIDKYVNQMEIVGLVLTQIAVNVPLNYYDECDTSVFSCLIDGGYFLISKKDEDGILRTGFSILGSIVNKLGDSQLSKTIFSRILEILKQHNKIIVKKMALQCLKEIAENSKEQTELLVDLKLSNILFEFLKIDDPSLKFLACRILNLMATVESSIFLDHKNLDLIFLTVRDIPDCRWECIKICKNVLTYCPTFTNSLVEYGIIKHIFNSMMFYRSIDEVLMEAYSYEGTFTNLCYLADCFAILNAIIHKGYNLKQTKINIFYEYFDQFCVDCFQELLQDLLENNIEFQIQINRSYVKQYCKEGFETLLLEFAVNFREIHNNSSEFYSNVTGQLQSLLSIIGEKFKEMKIGELRPEVLGQQIIRIILDPGKNFYTEDIRVLEVPQLISLRELLEKIHDTYEFYEKIMIKRMKKNQDNYTIDSDNLLHRFIKEAIDEARATKSFNTIPELRIKVEFWKIPPPQQDEVTCVDCFKTFDILELNEPLDMNKPFQCGCQQQIKFINSPYSKYGTPKYHYP